MRRIELDARSLFEKETMAAYMKEQLALPEWFGGNLDALADCLSEVAEDTEIMIGRTEMEWICTRAYAWKVLRVLADAAAENPHLTIRLSAEERSQNILYTQE